MGSISDKSGSISNPTNGSISKYSGDISYPDTGTITTSGTGGSNFNILLESGGNLLAENGDFLVQEAA